MELNRKAEVSLHAQAADLEFTLERMGKNIWKLTVNGLVELASVLTDNEDVWNEQVFTLTDKQASAAMALFIGEIEDDKTLNTMLYDII